METRNLMAWGLSSALFIAASLSPLQASACGCFALADPASSVVQAGEQIVFGHKDGQVTMHVQVQYAGPASEFGWLLPMPAVPELEIGSSDLFLELQGQTAPSYRANWIYDRSCQSNGVGVDGGAIDASSSAPDSGAPPPAPPPSVLVRREAVGPYDTAILRADDQAEMLAWLRDNDFYIPDALGQAVAAYIRPGSYFLALKLLKDRDAGDIAPIVLDYPSDLPMIPMVLTQVGAVEDMPVTVWVLGEDRAIPRNYRHTVLNEEHIDWFTGGSNYEEVVTAAVDEAEGHHSFVTEFAGSTESMIGRLDGNRYGSRSLLEAMDVASEYLNELGRRQFALTSELLAILQDVFPMPDSLRAAGITEREFYSRLAYYLGPYKDRNPEQYEGVTFDFDPAALTDRIWRAIVVPARNAGALFREHPKMTRLFTTLSPEEMTKDPVFSFNPVLPDVSNVHTATFEVRCEPSGNSYAGTLTLPDGRRFETSPDEWTAGLTSNGTPRSQRIEILGEEGPPKVEVDNTLIVSTGGPAESRNRSSCTCTDAHGGAGSIALFAGLMLVAGKRRRRARGR